MDLPAYCIRGNDPEFFRTAVSQADGTNPVILVFHGVPEYVHPWVDLEFPLFREYMNFLKDFAIIQIINILINLLILLIIIIVS